jgi:hypothetical protein
VKRWLPSDGEPLSDLLISLAATLRQRIRAFDPTHVFFIADMSHGPILYSRGEGSGGDIHVVEFGGLRMSNVIGDIEHGA